MRICAAALETLVGRTNVTKPLKDLSQGLPLGKMVVVF